MVSIFELIHPCSFNSTSLLIPPHSMSPVSLLDLSPGTYWEHPPEYHSSITNSTKPKLIYHPLSLTCFLSVFQTLVKGTYSVSQDSSLETIRLFLPPLRDFPSCSLLKCFLTQSSLSQPYYQCLGQGSHHNLGEMYQTSVTDF